MERVTAGSDVCRGGRVLPAIPCPPFLIRQQEPGRFEVGQVETRAVVFGRLGGLVLSQVKMFSTMHNNRYKTRRFRK